MSQWKLDMYRTEEGKKKYEKMMSDIVQWYQQKQLRSVKYEPVKWMLHMTGMGQAGLLAPGGRRPPRSTARCAATGSISLLWAIRAVSA